MKVTGQRVGIVANEFFDARIGRMGGFGWVARTAAETLRELSPSGPPVFLSGEYYEWGEGSTYDSEGIELVLSHYDAATFRERLAACELGSVLTIDYRQNYDYPLQATDAPVTIWVQDPRPQDDVDKVATLRIPGRESEPPLGISFVDCTGLAAFVEGAQNAGRPVHFSSPAPGLIDKFAGTYGFSVDRLEPMPYSLELQPSDGTKSPRPRVVFLGRLDPIKRPWVFAELARSFPKVEFAFLGQSHFTGPGAWEPRALPENVVLYGHLDGAAKHDMLASAWILVNPSIHEALPVSFVEALAHRLPIVSCQDPEGVVSRFGAYVGRWDGTGLDGLAAFEQGLGDLLEDPARREAVGRAGQRWALDTHGPRQFLAGFQRCLAASEPIGRGAVDP